MLAVAATALGCSFNSTGGSGDDGASGSDGDGGSAGPAGNGNGNGNDDGGGTRDGGGTTSPAAPTGNSMSATGDTSLTGTSLTTDPGTSGDTTAGGTDGETTGPVIDQACESDDVTLAACYLFETLVNGFLVDDSANSNTGFAVDLTLAAGMPGAGMAGNFQATSFVTVDDSNSLDVTELTISAWIRPESIGGTQIVVANQGQWALSLDGNSVRCERPGGSLSGSASIPTDAWSHVACRVDSEGEADVYLDGVNVGENGIGALTNNTSDPMHVGHNANGTGDIIGLMDTIKIYNAAKSDAFICSLAAPNCS